MSITAIEWAFRQAIDIPSAKLVLLAIADHANRHDFCWPSIERIVQRTGLSRATVFRSIDTLTGLGLLHQAPQPGRSNRYTLAIEQSQGETPVSHDETPTRLMVRPHPSYGETLTVKNRQREPSTKRALPADWQPDAALLTWAQERTPHVDTTIETEKFVNHWQSTGERKADWRATWRNWILRAMRDYAPRPVRFPSRLDGQRERNHQRIRDALDRRNEGHDERTAGRTPQLRLIEGGAG